MSLIPIPAITLDDPTMRAVGTVIFLIIWAIGSMSKMRKQAAKKANRPPAQYPPTDSASAPAEPLAFPPAPTNALSPLSTPGAQPTAPSLLARSMTSTPLPPLSTLAAAPAPPRRGQPPARRIGPPPLSIQSPDAARQWPSAAPSFKTIIRPASRRRPAPPAAPVAQTPGAPAPRIVPMTTQALSTAASPTQVTSKAAAQAPMIARWLPARTVRAQFILADVLHSPVALRSKRPF